MFENGGTCGQNWIYDHSRQICYQRPMVIQKGTFDQAQGICRNCSADMLSFESMADWNSLQTPPVINITILPNSSARHFWFDLQIISAANGSVEITGSSFQPSDCDDLPATGATRDQCKGKEKTNGLQCFLAVFKTGKKNLWKLRNCSDSRWILCQRNRTGEKGCVYKHGKFLRLYYVTNILRKTLQGNSHRSSTVLEMSVVVSLRVM